MKIQINIAVVVLVLVATVIAMIQILPMILPIQNQTNTNQTGSANETIGTNETNVITFSEPTILELDLMNANPPEDYFDRLSEVIAKGNDSYIREKAVFTLTAIAIRENETEPVVDLLKDMVTNETDDNVRTAAYVNADLIRENEPLEDVCSMNITTSGEMRLEGNFSIIATVLCSRDFDEAMVGIGQLNDSIVLLSEKPRYKFSIKANEATVLQFDINVTENGKYYVPLNLKVNYDLVDDQKYEKRIYFNVYDSFGEVLHYNE